ncbi:ATP-binding protein [Thermoflexus sp.]|uniref:ATP-binding protein n=1 Tax=Thermoflexus sp. TaxID=1969742 RepID=UPI002ADE811D|nr:ATP-binding protein [Thermoflexus sp.]
MSSHDSIVAHQLEVENFRGIARAQLTLTPLTVLVGLNGSGKTAVLEALYLVGGHRSGRVELSDRDPVGRSPILHVLRRHAYLEKEPRAPDAELLLGSEDQPEEKPDGDPVEDGSSKAHRSSKPTLKIHFAELRIRSPRWLIRLGTDQARLRISSSPTFQLRDEWDRHRQAVLLDPSVGVELEEALWFPRDPVDPLIQREPPMLMEGRDEWVAQRLREIYDGLPIRRFAGGAGGGERPRTVWAVINGQPVAIEQLGDGIQTAFRALCLMALVESGLFLWDEPEDHQHPDAIKRLMKTLVEVLRKRPALQAVIATQSREVLEALREIGSQDEEQEWVRESLSVLFLILDANDGRLRAERFTYEEFSAFEEAEVDIRKFWTRRYIP